MFKTRSDFEPKLSIRFECSVDQRLLDAWDVGVVQNDSEPVSRDFDIGLLEAFVYTMMESGFNCIFHWAAERDETFKDEKAHHFEMRRLPATTDKDI